jgi:hypothetical protein
MPGLKSALRGRLFKAIHAEAAKRKIDHDGLHDLFVSRCKVRSMSEVSDGELARLYKEWTGKGIRRRATLPKRGEAKSADSLQMITAEELGVLDQEFSKRGMGHEGRANFIRRQLRGRDVIRTRRDYARVFAGIRAMNRREGL